MVVDAVIVVEIVVVVDALVVVEIVVCCDLPIAVRQSLRETPG